MRGSLKNFRASFFCDQAPLTQFARVGKNLKRLTEPGKAL
jgi:hypothetical protein